MAVHANEDRSTSSYLSFCEAEGVSELFSFRSDDVMVFFESMFQS